MRILLPILLAGLSFAAKGTIIVETEHPDGRRCPADLQVMRSGSSSVLKSLSSMTGKIQTQLDPGSYSVKAIAKGSGNTGTRTVQVESGQTLLYLIKITSPPASSSSTSSGSTPTVSGSTVPSSGSTVAPPKRRVSGKITSGDATTKGGYVIFYKEAKRASVSKGKFAATGLEKGNYRAVFYDSKKRKRGTKSFSIGSENVSIAVRAKPLSLESSTSSPALAPR